MDVQLKELIETIKSEGVKPAEQQAEEIIKNAKSQADQIIQKAKEDAEKIKADAKNDAEKFKVSGNEAVKQAARDLILKLEGEIKAIFSSLIENETAGTLKGATLEDAILSVFKSWKSDSEEYVLQVSENDKQIIQAAFLDKLKKEFSKEIEIKPFRNIKAGFRISQKDGSAYYNFTSEGIAEILAEFVNPKLKEIIKKAAGQE